MSLRGYMLGGVAAGALGVFGLLVHAGANPMMSAADLLKACTTPSMHWVDFCNGFMQAAHDAAALEGAICITPGTTRTDLAETYERVAPELFDRRPDAAEREGVRVAGEIFAMIYPCQ